MRRDEARDLDLNLLRVFVAVAEAGSVTSAAKRLYLTQPAVSAALKRLTTTVGAPLFARVGRGLVLTGRGQRLLDASRPHLDALVAAALSPGAFDPLASERTLRIGLSDVNQAWLLPPLLRAMAREAPRMHLVVVEVQFRTVGDLLASQRVDLAVTVADDLPAGAVRRPLFTGNFVGLFDPAFAKIGKKLTRERYFEHDHVIVSYNADLRGIVEDVLGEHRRVRLSVPSFHGIGDLVRGTSLVATVPRLVARHVLSAHPRLRTAELPFTLSGAWTELIWRAALEDDGAVRFVRDRIMAIAQRLGTEVAGPAARR